MIDTAEAVESVDCMSTTQIDGRVALNKPVRAIFCNVLEARKFKRNGKEVGESKFDATFILDKDDTKLLVAKAREVATAKWPGKDMKEIKFPFKTAEKMRADATAKSKDPEIYPAGTFIMAARSQYAPALARFVNKIPTSFGAADATEAKQKFYNGCWVVPKVNFVAYTGDDGKLGITAYLDALLWIKDGERIGGTVDPKEAFKGYVGTVSDIDPTGGDIGDDLSGLV